MTEKTRNAVALTVLTVGGLIVGASRSAWAGVESGDLAWDRGITPLFTVTAVLGVVVGLGAGAALLRAEIRPGWWAAILPLFGLGGLLGMVAMPLAVGDVLAGVWMGAFLLPVAAVVLLWMAAWSLLMTVRGRNIAHRPATTN